MPITSRSGLPRTINQRTAPARGPVARVAPQPSAQGLRGQMRSMLGIPPRVRPAGAERVSISPDKPTDDRFNPSTHPSTGNVPRARSLHNGIAAADPEAWAQPLKLGAVNANNEIEARTMKAFAESMLLDIETTRNIISGQPPRQAALQGSLRKKLLHETEVIKNLLMDCINLEYAETDNIHFFLREKFKQISTRSQKIVEYIPSRYRAKNRNARVAPDTPEAILSDLFEDFSQFANELKRHHFTRANDKQLEDYAERQFRQILYLVPGLALQRKGSEMEFVRSLSASLLLGHDAFGLKLGAEGKYTYASAKRIFNDQDGSYVNTKLNSHGFMASAMLKFGALFPTKEGEPRHLAKLIASIQVKRSRGTWNEYKCLKDWLKGDIIYKSSQWKHCCRSGDPNSFGNRLRAKFHRRSSFILGDVVGVKYVTRDLMPAVNQKKREKGSFNTDRLETYANRISRRLQGVNGATTSSLTEITKLAYPSINSLIPNDAGKSDTPLKIDEKQFSCLVDAASMPGPAMSAPRSKGQSVRRHSVSGKIEGSFDSLDVINPKHGQIHLGARGSGEIEWSDSHTDFFRLKAVHEHLDPRYSNDIDKSKYLLDEIKRPDRNLPTAHFLQNLPTDPPGGYGELAQLPTARWWDFGEPARRRGIMQQKFDNLYSTIQTIDQNYKTFSDLAMRKFSFRESAYRKANPVLYTQFKEDLKTFIYSTFGIREANLAQQSVEKQKLYKNMLNENNPEYFIVKGYESMSIALGAVGIDIFDNNEVITSCFSREEFDKHADENQASLEVHRNNVDIRYQNLRNRMDGVFLPIDKEHLLRKMCIRAEGNTILLTIKLTGFAEAGIDSNPLYYIPGNEQGATELPNNVPGNEHGATELPNNVPGNEQGANDRPHSDRSNVNRPNFSMSSLAAGVSMGISTLRNNIPVHSNPLRTGHFYDTRLTISGEGVLAAVVPVAVAFAENNLKKNNYLETSPTLRKLLRLPRRITPVPATAPIPQAQAAAAAPAPAPNPNAAVADPNRHGDANDISNLDADTGAMALTLSKLVGRTATSEFSRGGEIAVIRRTPYPREYDGQKYEYKCLTQSVRFIERSAQKISLAAGVPLHLVGSPVPVTVTAGVSRSVSDGNVAYEILGPCPSYQILSFCELQSVINKSGNSFTSFDPAKLDSTNFNKMRDLFLNRGGPNEKIDSDFLLHKFFGARDSILGFLANYVESQNGRRGWGIDTPRARRDSPNERTEFDRIDDDPEYWAMMQNMRRSKQSAPGPGSIWNNVGPEQADPRPLLNRDQIADINSVIEHFNGIELTPEERMRFFMENDKGRKVFQSYCQILRAYEEISEGMKARNAYDAKFVVQA